jgi:hypothetical protein
MKLVLLISLVLSFFAYSAFAILSPGYGVGTTDFDWLRNGSLGKDVVLDGQHGVHVYWTYRAGGDPNTRRSYYNFKDETGNWFFAHIGTGVDGRVSRMGSLAVLSDGRACVAAHASIGGTRVWVDAARGAGAFSGPYEVDPNNPAYPIWPIIARGGNEVLHVNGATNGQPNHWYSRSTDEGQTWTPWFQLCSDGLGGGWNTLTAQGSKVGWVYPDINYQLYYRESPDAGVTWGVRSLIHRADSCGGFLWQDALYSPSGELHVVYDVRDTTLSSTRAQIRHWSPSTGVSLVRSGWWESNAGAAHSTVSCPQLGYNARNNTWWCTWVEFTLADTGANGWSNGEVWAAYSADGGRTWRGPRNLTNTPTPGAPAGACADDRYASLAAVVDDTLRVLYLSSFDAGSSQYESGAVTVDTMRYYELFGGDGVEEDISTALSTASAKLTVFPNPFASFATIPGQEGENFELYDISGRRIGTYRGDRIGQDLGPGVYFLKFEHGHAKPFRIVKVK